MKINDKINLPLDSQLTITGLKELVKDLKKNNIKLVNWTVIKIYDSHLTAVKLIEMKYRNKIHIKPYIVVEEIKNYIKENLF
jgi:hypothetical protein